jgi:hypothetical protein
MCAIIPRVPLPSLVIGGGRSRDDGDVKGGSLPQLEALGLQVGVDFRQKSLPQVALLQYAVEFEDAVLSGRGPESVSPTNRRTGPDS